MQRLLTSKGILLMFLALQPSVLCGQSMRYGQPPSAYGPAAKPRPDPREQRAARERAVAVVGASGRDFVEMYGEDAVAAICACSQSVAVQLVQFHSSGGLGKLSRPRDLLRVIGRPKHGDDVAFWAIAHAKELAVADNFDAYLLDPLSYALALKKLEDGAAEVREFRRAYDSLIRPQAWGSRSSSGWRMPALVGGVAAVVALLVWRFRKNRTQNPIGD